MSATNERLILPLEQIPANNTKPESEHQLFTFLYKAYSGLFCLHEARKSDCLKYQSSHLYLILSQM